MLLTYGLAVFCVAPHVVRQLRGKRPPGAGVPDGVHPSPLRFALILVSILAALVVWFSPFARPQRFARAVPSGLFPPQMMAWYGSVDTRFCEHLPGCSRLR